MKSLRIAVAIAGFLAAAVAGSVQAVPIPFTFRIDFNSGPLSGQVAPGTLTVDGNDCPGACMGNFDPTDVAKTLLSFNITVGGVPFAMNNDTGFGFGPFPDVTFDAFGNLSQIDYQGQVNFGGLSYVFDTTGSSGGANIGDLVAFYQGTVGIPASLVSLGTLAVPEPGTLPLLGIALVGIAVAWRRKATAAPR